MSNIIIPFLMGLFFGGFLVSILYYKLPSFYKVICGAFDSFYKKKSKEGIILKDWRK